MNRGIQVAIAAALGIGGSFLANSAQATPIPDQSQVVETDFEFVGFFTNGTQKQLAQTFTVGISGILSRIDISLTKNSENATEDIVIDIRPTTSSGAPDPDDTHSFLTASVSPSSVLKFPGISLVTFDFSSSNFSVVAGDILAITISSAQSTPNQYNVRKAGDLLGGGALFSRTGGTGDWSSTSNDLTFETFVEPIPDPSTNLDHFLSYKIKRSRGAPKFEKLEVTLTDQFESDVLFEVKKPKEIYNPADKNGEGIFDPDTHLVAYEIKRAKTKPRQPKHVKQTNIEVLNQFGTISVDTKKPDRLLVPSLKDLNTAIPDMDVPDEFPVDHFKCYKVEVSKGSEFPEGIQVTVGDQFTALPVVFEVEKPKRLCNPVDKNGEGIQNPDDQLLCYKIRQVNFNGIHVNNQFGPLQLDLEKKEAELCVPSTKTLP